MEFFRKKDEKGLFGTGKEPHGSIEVISAIIYIIRYTFTDPTFRRKY